MSIILCLCDRAALFFLYTSLLARRLAVRKILRSQRDTGVCLFFALGSLSLLVEELIKRPFFLTILNSVFNF